MPSLVPEVIFEFTNKYEGRLCGVPTGETAEESYRIVRIPDVEEGEKWKEWAYYSVEKLSGVAAMGEPIWENVNDDASALFAVMIELADKLRAKGDDDA